MNVTEPPSPTGLDLAAADKVRPAPELWQGVMHPLTMGLVRAFARLGVDPQAVVWTHSLLGLLAALLIVIAGAGDQGAAASASLLWPAALLLQLKTVLDNVDGSLARATGQVTQMGRYLDTVLDTAVNLLLFLALAWHGPGPWAWAMAVGAYLVLMLLFSLDFNLKRLYRRAAGATAGSEEAPAGAPPKVLAFFRRSYQIILAPQDRLMERWDAGLFRRLTGLPLHDASQETRAAWHDRWIAGSLANLGLSTQLLLLGICLVIGRPFWYVYLVYAMGLYALGLQGLRARRFSRRPVAAS